LTKEGIYCTLDNDLISTVLPYPAIDIKLKVEKNQVEQAIAIIHLINEEVNNLDLHDFREADEADIAFEKKLYESKRDKKGNGLFLFFVITLIFVILMFILLK
jgi:hypothetical protein